MHPGFWIMPHLPLLLPPRNAFHIGSWIGGAAAVGIRPSARAGHLAMDLDNADRLPSPHFGDAELRPAAGTAAAELDSRVGTAVGLTREVAIEAAACRRSLVRRAGRRYDPRKRIHLAAGVAWPRALADRQECAAYLVEKQLPGGGWAMYPGGRMEISGSVKAYFALKLTGHDPQADYMRVARQAIRAAGRCGRRQQLHAVLPRALGPDFVRSLPGCAAGASAASHLVADQHLSYVGLVADDHGAAVDHVGPQAEAANRRGAWH